MSLLNLLNLHQEFITFLLQIIILILLLVVLFTRFDPDVLRICFQDRNIFPRYFGSLNMVSWKSYIDLVLDSRTICMKAA